MFLTSLIAWLAALLRLFGLPAYRSPIATKISLTNCVAGQLARLTVNTKYCAGIYATVTHADGSRSYEGDITTVNGFVVFLTLSTAEMTIKLTLDPYPEAAHVVDAVDYEFKRAVGTKPPKLKCWAPRKILASDQLCVRWEADTETKVEFHVYQGSKIASFTKEKNVGVKHVPLNGTEDAIVEFLATDRFSKSIKIKTVKVRDVAPRIRVQEPLQCAPPGEMVMFTWAVEGHPQEVWIEAPARGERHILEPVGTFLIKMGDRPEEFVLMARCRDKVSSVVLRATPWYGLESPHA